MSPDGPYDAHLVRDVGGLHLALAAVSAAAACMAVCTLAEFVSAAWLRYGAGLAHHATHLELSATVDAVGQVIALSVQVVVIPACLLVQSSRTASDR